MSLDFTNSIKCRCIYPSFWQFLSLSGLLKLHLFEIVYNYILLSFSFFLSSSISSASLFIYLYLWTVCACLTTNEFISLLFLVFLSVYLKAVCTSISVFLLAVFLSDMCTIFAHILFSFFFYSEDLHRISKIETKLVRRPQKQTQRKVLDLGWKPGRSRKSARLKTSVTFPAPQTWFVKLLHHQGRSQPFFPFKPL